MEGVLPRLPQIKIIHQGQLFKMPDDTKPEVFEAIILDQHAANAWWEKAIVSGAPPEKPDCFSIDGVYPDKKCTKIQCETCKDCKQNQFESDRKGGKGKDCKNMKRLHIFMEGKALPRRLSVPPTSITSFEKYMTELVDRGLPFPCVVTEFSLLKHDDGTNEYSEIIFIKGRVLVGDELYFVADLIKKYKDGARLQDIDSEEYETQPVDKEPDTSFNYGPSDDIPL